mgnify:CR=1 FL=1
MDCLQSLLEIINQFIETNEELKPLILEQSEDIVIKSLTYIHLIGNYTLLIEQNRGESFDDL